MKITVRKKNYLTAVFFLSHQIYLHNGKISFHVEHIVKINAFFLTNIWFGTIQQEIVANTTSTY